MHPSTITPNTDPLYQQVADHFRARINSGDLAPGQQLPTEPQVALQFGVSRQTARDGLQVLIREGLIVAERPRGHFVRRWEHMDYWPQSESQHHPTTAAMDRYRTQITGEGRDASQTIDVSLVEATPLVADRLRLPAGEVVVARRRVRYINGQPVNLCDSHHPLDIVQGSEIMKPGDVSRGTNRVLAELGYPLTDAADEITARMPTPTEAHRLGLHPGAATPVMVHVNIGYTKDDRPVRCTVNVLPADRHVIRFDRKFDERIWEES